MLISLNWIKDYVKLPDDMDLSKLAYDLTMSTVEVEGTHDLAKDFENTFNAELTERILSALRDKGLKVYFDGNDILVDNLYKIASSGTRRLGDLLFCTFHISYEVDLELIRQICTKPMVKTPKGFKDYGFTQEDVLNIFLEHVKNYGDEIEITETPSEET